MERTLCCDISFYQDAPSTTIKPELSKMLDVGIQGVILRISQNLTLDSMFAYYWNECQVHNIPHMVYGFLQYWSGSVDAGMQGKFIGDWMKGKEKVRGWCDFERPNANFSVLPPRQDCLNMIQNWMNQVDAGTGIESGLYTNLSTLAYLSPLPDWLKKRPFWLAWPITIPANTDVAEYTKNVFPPTTLMNRVSMWQFSWQGPGLLAGMESKGLDMDWYFGSLKEFKMFCKGITELPSASSSISASASQSPSASPSQTNIKAELKVLIEELAVLVEELP